MREKKKSAIAHSSCSMPDPMASINHVIRADYFLNRPEIVWWTPALDSTPLSSCTAPDQIPSTGHWTSAANGTCVEFYVFKSLIFRWF